MRIARVEGGATDKLASKKMARDTMAALPGVELRAKAEDGQPSKRLQLIPIGQKIVIWQFDAKTEEYVRKVFPITREWCEQLIANTERVRQGAEVPIFVDHCVWGKSKGWGDHLSMILSDTHLEIDMPRWTKATQQEIDDEEYKFISVGVPMISFDPLTGGTRGPFLREISLTNDPHFRGMNEVEARANNEGSIVLAAQFINDSEEEEMKNSEFAQMLNLPADASEEEIKAKATELAGSAVALTDLRAKAGLKEGEDFPEELFAKAGDPKPEPTPEPAPVVAGPVGEGVAKAVVATMQATGRLAPAQADEAVKLYASFTQEQLDGVVATAGKVIPDSANLNGLIVKEPEDLGISANAMKKSRLSKEQIKAALADEDD